MGQNAGVLDGIFVGEAVVGLTVGAEVVGAADGPKVGPGVFAPLQVTVTYKCLTVPEHGSLNTVLVAESEHEARFKQALETTLIEEAALHDEYVYAPHEPPGVP